MEVTTSDPAARSENRSDSRFEPQARMLANRVKKVKDHLARRFARQNIEIYRLYDWDIPEIRAVVDWYAGYIVIAEYMRTQSVPQWLPSMGAGIAQKLHLPLENVIIKRRWAGKKEGQRYARLNDFGHKEPMCERDLKFLINLNDYIDTGLFSDHRNTRQMIREMAMDRDFLNLFCYTGAFTCYAAKGGARFSVSVDRAKSAIAWAGENLSLNQVDPKNHHLIQAHVLEYLSRARREGRRFDLAVVDPPSFSTTRSRQDAFDVVKDHPALLKAVLKVIRPGGTVFFSTNHQNFALQAEGLGFAAVTEITHLTIPEDYVRKRQPIHRCWRMTA